MRISERTLVEMHRGLYEKEFTSVELTQDALDLVAERDQVIDAFLAIDKEAALSQARAADERGYSEAFSLNGIPIGIKDNIVTKDLTTTAASKILENFVPIYDATVVQKLKDAGAVIIGKLNLDEFAMGSSTETSYFKKTKNAWNQDYVPGGSSGGSAAAVGSRMLAGSLGSDTGGSIRQPALYNGVVGMKPTYGRVSRYGLIAFASSLDQIGPMTRTVTDNAHLLEAICGLDKMDSTSSPKEVPHFADLINPDIKGLKVGLPKEFMTDAVSEETRKNVEDVKKRLEALGASVQEISLPHALYGISVYYVLASSEASSNLQRFDGIRYGFRADHVKNLEELFVKTRSEGFGKEVKRRIMLGTFSLSSGYYDAYFKKAAQVRTLIKEDFAKAFSDIDLILAPVSPDVAFKFGQNADDPVKMYMADLLTIPVNLAGLPSLALPTQLNAKGLPMGIQLIGPAFDEQTLYNVGYALEQDLKFTDQAEF